MLTILLTVVRWVLPMLSGVIIGVVAYITFERVGVRAYSHLVSTAVVGIVVALILFVVLQITRVVLRAKLKRAASASALPIFRSLCHRLLQKDLSEEEAAKIAEKIASVAEAWILGLGVFSLLGLIVTLTGTIVLLGQTLAA